MNNFQDKANFIWSVADEVLRDDLKSGKYRDVILPFTVIRRLECVLEPTKEKVIQKNEELKGKVKDRESALCRESKQRFYNTSEYDMKKLLDDSKNIKKNFLAYIDAFSENVKEIISKFKIETYIDQLDENNLLYLLISKFSNVDLHPDEVSNIQMGYIFEELLRKFNESMNENPGEHFTPREVIALMVHLLFYQDKDILSQSHPVRTVYDPACGTGGMLTVSKDYVRDFINPDADLHLYGQEVNPETYAIAKSELLLKGDGRDAENIKEKSTLSSDAHPTMTFHYQLANPPFGKDWSKDKEKVEEEAKKGFSGRFGAGLPRKSDGQLLFLQTMISKMRAPEEGGGRVAIVMNGSPLFTGDAGSGESEIRRWIIEKDYLEAIVALPDQLFYNTGIFSYVWILTNRKEERREGKVQLINGTTFFVNMRKSLGNKRHEISSEQIEYLTLIHNSFNENEHSQIHNNNEFGYRKITIDRPLKLSFQVTDNCIEMLKEQTAFQNISVSKKRKNNEEKEKEEAEGRRLQESVLKVLSGMDKTIVYKNRDEFAKVLNKSLKNAGLSIESPVKKAIFSVMSERDETADICKDSKGNVEYDSDLRDYENVPLSEDIHEYFEREVKPYAPDSWINESITDEKDGKVGKVGYIINFNQYFYEYQPPRSLKEIENDINSLESEILDMLGVMRQ
ncbi:type I restriction-modification system subunit M [Methanosarcina mazei]|uniref:site-specific DNA-methyltransferase (adenine-specific) n=1 Tax=Methanosarcina mazei S-6 TaxID=213585 RepID=A0A0E3RCW6_METMZ|nr:class I SAM-dependent DNA methyltransferase [Methanosarcina mazei]AKB63747.1 Type I restriction-modification system, DNA-methyltransferase subunit M [Methanosarcina mazei S-6]